MKLSDFENEAALDLLAQLIDPATEIMNDPKIVQTVRSGKPIIFAVKEILKSHKQAAIEIVSAMHGEDVGKFRFNVLTLAKDLMDLMNDPDVLAVFSSQSQKEQERPSGSATVSTEDEKE